MPHSPTDEQAQIIADIAQPGPSVMIQAGAGTAKSTTLELAAPGVKVPALALAFNKSIAVELGKRLPANFTVKTFNGFGHGALMRGLPGVSKWNLETRGKLGKLVSQAAKDAKVSLSGDQWDSIRQLVAKAQQAGIVPRDEGRGLTPDSHESWLAIAEDLFIPEDEIEFSIELGRQVLEENNKLTAQGTISFDDQVYASACLWGKFPQFPFMSVDEAQDLNPLNHYMIQQAMRPDGRLAVVGDPRQAIYGFRGADHMSMDTMRGLKSSWQDRELTMTFRCPKEIVKRQLEHYPRYRAAPANPEGRFMRFEAGGAEQWDGWTFKDVQKALSEIPKPRPSLVVMCRNNAPLLSLAFKLIRQGIGVNMLGREIGKGLITLSRKIAPEDLTPADITRGLIQDWMEAETSLALANGKDERVAPITDRGECLLAALDNSGVTSAGDLRIVLEKLFSSEGAGVTLGSGHKVKGLEWDCGVHLDPWRIPSKYAREAAKKGDTSQLQQERNLKYVIETRVTHTLINANLEDFQ